MEKWVKRIHAEQKVKRNEPLEVKQFGQNYYLYKSTTVWNKIEKKRKKVSRYIGKITEQGLEEEKRSCRCARSIFEYGNAKLLSIVADEIIPALKDAFPDDYGEILAMSFVRVVQYTALKSVKSHWEKFYLSDETDVSLSPNMLSEKLRIIGSDWNSQKEFFDQLLSHSKYLLFDLSYIFSSSENLNLAEKGHNTDHIYLKQVNFALIFSLDRNLPVMLKPIPGSIRDMKSIKKIMEEIHLKSAVIVLDRGFASYTLPDLLGGTGTSFVLPLKRNFKIIDYDADMKKSFVYRDRGINWTRKKIGDHFLYLFEDVKLRAEEETTFIELIAQRKRTQTKLREERRKFGKIALLSDIDDDGQEIYLMFKTREEIEIAFDAMKNEMENDKIYLSNDDAVRGYFFITFISLYLHFRILQMLREHELIGKLSVNDLLFELSKVYLVHYSDGKKRLSEIPARVEDLEKDLGLKLFPKELRS